MVFELLSDCIGNVLSFCSADAYSHTDSEFLKSENTQNRDAGSTASTAILVGDRLLVANVGDSRAVICRGGNGKPLVKVPIKASALHFRLHSAFIMSNCAVFWKIRLSLQFITFLSFVFVNCTFYY